MLKNGFVLLAAREMYKTKIYNNYIRYHLAYKIKSDKIKQNMDYTRANVRLLFHIKHLNYFDVFFQINKSTTNL